MYFVIANPGSSKMSRENKIDIIIPRQLEKGFDPIVSTKLFHFVMRHVLSCVLYFIFVLYGFYKTKIGLRTLRGRIDHLFASAQFLISKTTYNALQFTVV